MDNVVFNFNSMTASFEKVRSMSSMENKNIQDTADNFNKIISQISNIAEISQEHAAYIEEIQATIDEQNNRIINSDNAINDMEKSCRELEKIVLSK
jgi:methyl-accepting chemotaxis protein